MAENAEKLEGPDFEKGCVLDKLAEVIWEPDAEPGPPISIAWVLAPLGRGIRKRPRVVPGSPGPGAA